MIDVRDKKYNRISLNNVVRFIPSENNQLVPDYVKHQEHIGFCKDISATCIIFKFNMFSIAYKDNDRLVLNEMEVIK